MRGDQVIASIGMIYICGLDSEVLYITLRMQTQLQHLRRLLWASEHLELFYNRVNNLLGLCPDKGRQVSGESLAHVPGVFLSWSAVISVQNPASMSALVDRAYEGGCGCRSPST